MESAPTMFIVFTSCAVGAATCRPQTFGFYHGRRATSGRPYISCGTIYHLMFTPTQYTQGGRVARPYDDVRRTSYLTLTNQNLPEGQS